MNKVHRGLDEIFEIARRNQPAAPMLSNDRLFETLDSAVGELSEPETVSRNRSSRGTTGIMAATVLALLLIGAAAFHFMETTPAPNSAVTGRTQPEKATAPVVAPDEGRRLDSPVETPVAVTNSPQADSITESGGHAGEPMPDVPKELRPGLPAIAVPGIIVTDLDRDVLEYGLGIRIGSDRIDIATLNRIIVYRLNEAEQARLSRLGYSLANARIDAQGSYSLTLAPDLDSDYTPLVPPTGTPLLPLVAVTLIDKRGEGMRTTFGDPGEALEEMSITPDELSEAIVALGSDKEQPSHDALLSTLVAIHIPTSYQTGGGRAVEADLFLWCAPTAQLLAMLPDSVARRIEERRTFSQNVQVELTDRDVRERNSQETVAPVVQPSTVERSTNEISEALHASEPIRVVDGTFFSPGHLLFARHSRPDSGSATTSPALTSFRHDPQVLGLRTLNLTESELKGLGVTRTERGYSVGLLQRQSAIDSAQRAALADLGYPSTAGDVALGFDVRIDSTTLTFHPIPASEAATIQVAPVIISQEWTRPNRERGLNMVHAFTSPMLEQSTAESTSLLNDIKTVYRVPHPRATDTQQRKPLEALGTMVPVRLSLRESDRINDGKDGAEAVGSDILLWYVPTAEFVEALPERYRKPLLKELSLAASIQEGDVTPAEACDRLAGEPSVLEICRAGSGALTISGVRPNPAHGHTTVHFTLAEKESVALLLHDLSGTYLRMLKKPESFDAGKQAITIPLESVNAGLYLLVLRTSAGDQVIRRLVVQ